MKVAIFTETYLPYINGVVTHVRLLKEGLESLGHQVLIVTADPTTKHHRIDDGILRCPAFTFKKIYGYGVASPVSAKRLTILGRFNPDIIHIHNEFGVGFFGMQAAGLLKVPLVYTIHTMYDDYLHYVAPSGMTQVLNKAVTGYLKMLTHSASAIIGPSAKVEELCRRHGVTAQVHIIKNCPDLRAFNPAERRSDLIAELKKKYNIPENAKIMTTISRIAQEKSMDVLIIYFSKCFKNDEEYRLIIVGNGPAKDSLQEQARLLGLSDKVIFTGAVPNTEVPNFCHMADLFVSASLSEIYSISMLEALAAGLPAVIKRDEINNGQIQHGVNGFIFDDEVGFEKYVREYFAMTPEEQKALKESVINSVSGYGSTELATDVVEVYKHAEKQFRIRKGHGSSGIRKLIVRTKK